MSGAQYGRYGEIVINITLDEDALKELKQVEVEHYTVFKAEM